MTTEGVVNQSDNVMITDHPPANMMKCQGVEVSNRIQYCQPRIELLQSTETSSKKPPCLFA